MGSDSEPGSAGVETTRAEDSQPTSGHPRFGGPDPIRVALEDALAAAQHKQAAARARLTEAHEEAQSLIRDATHQAMLVGAAAEQAAEYVLAEAQAEADQERAQAKLTATAFRAQAEQILLGAQREADQRHAHLAADLTRSWSEHERELLAVAQAEADAARSAADQQAATVLDQARREAARLLSAAEDRLDDAEQDATARRLEATRQSTAVLAQARDQAARELAAVVEQTAWAQQVVTGLIDTATAEAGRIRGQAHAEAAAALRQARLRLGGVLASASGKLRQRRSELAHDLHAAADFNRQRLAEVTAESAALLARARRQAEATIGHAGELAAERHDRAERRLAEAEAGARVVREQVAEQVGRSQREMYEVRRAAKAQASLTISDAHAEAEDVRTLAYRLLAEAQAEVALLTERRDAIAAELGQLSGVIEALAAPDEQGWPPDPAAPAAAVAAEPVLGGAPAETGPVWDWDWAHPDQSAQDRPVEAATAVEGAEDQDSHFLLEQMMRAANEPEQQRSLSDSDARLRARRGRSAARACLLTV